ncbi:Sensor-like histidine kinase RcsD [Serratia rubidaea]|uniref:Sensor-like histidine kinase RcsD n=1 Tax=Serratia rubidaea TaxID=61652 RepID=A0A4U9HLE1_SERRU|nr:Sensor-like histidine kinase RcsD [Serratia rubidaea]
MQNQQLTISSGNIIRCFLVFIVLLFVSLGLYGYNYTNAYLSDKKSALNTIVKSLQKRVDIYRYVTEQVYERFGNTPMPQEGPAVMETRLRPDVYYVDKPYIKTDAVIFGNHDANTLTMMANISDYLDNRWGANTENYAMYYLNGQDNSLSLVTTQSLKDLTSRFRDSYLTNSARIAAPKCYSRPICSTSVKASPPCANSVSRTPIRSPSAPPLTSRAIWPR